ncbi:MAG: PHB depolymerase family esterase [Nitrospirota bacterium]
MIKGLFNILAVAMLAIAIAAPASATGGDNIIRSVPSGGHATQYILVKPRDLDPQEDYPLLVFLHGLGGSAEQTLRSGYPVFTRQGHYVLLPQAPQPHGRGYSWYDLGDPGKLRRDLDTAEHMVKRLIEEVVSEHHIDRKKMVLSGFSQGGRLSFYIGIRNPRLFAQIIPVGGYYMPEALDPYIDRLGGLKIRIVHGERDTVSPYDDIRQAYELLHSKGVDVTLTTHSGGHTCSIGLLQSAFRDIPRH